MPSFVANILDDSTVDGADIAEIRGEKNSKRTATATFYKGDHMAWIYGASRLRPDVSPFKGSMEEQVTAFLAANGLLN